MTVQWLRGYWFIASSLLALFLVAFIVVEALHVPLLSDPAPWLTKAGYAAAAVGVGLLVADVLLPVPASIVMIAQGALFGIAGGTALSLVGGLGATLVGFLIGRRGRGLVNHSRERVDAHTDPSTIRSKALTSAGKNGFV